MKNIMVSVVTDQNYLPTLLDLLSKARRRIDLMSYSFAIGSAAGKHNLKSAPYEIAVKLREIKAKRGDKLRIRFFTEGERETQHRNRVTAKFLEEAGIEVVYGATHAKGVCIDGRHLLFGSTNLSHQSIMKNHEANLLIDDRKVAKEFLRYFDHLWEGGGHGGIRLKDPLLADGDFLGVVLDMIARAKKTIDFAIYFFNHRDIEKALIGAHERGVKVRGLIHQHASFAMGYVRANRATVKRLKTAGLTELHFGPLHTFSHSKYLVVDRKEIALGTGNWLVEDVKVHPQLYIHLHLPTIARALVRHLEGQIC